MALDYTKFLKVKTETLEGEPVLPEGHFFATIKSWRTRAVDYKQGGGEEPVVTITFQITSADEDADLSDYDAVKFPLSKLRVDKDYGLDNARDLKSIRRIAEEICGLNVKGQDLDDTLNDLKGQDVLIHSQPRAGKGEREGEFFSNIDKVLAPS